MPCIYYTRKYPTTQPLHILVTLFYLSSRFLIQLGLIPLCFVDSCRHNVRHPYVKATTKVFVLIIATLSAYATSIQFQELFREKRVIPKVKKSFLFRVTMASHLLAIAQIAIKQSSKSDDRWIYVFKTSLIVGNCQYFGNIKNRAKGFICQVNAV